MTSLKTIAATAIIAVAGTVAAFGGLHLGQSPADAATAVKTTTPKTTYNITLTPKALAKLMQGQNNWMGTKHQTSGTHRQRQATNQANNYRSGSNYSQRSGSHSGSRCYDYGYNGSSHGSWGGSSHSGGWSGNCW